ncbi:MAG: ABC transporter permease [Trueperaceae bacterium]|nr:ABC transporter permease [Trueperaceae bacterium]
MADTTADVLGDDPVTAVRRRRMNKTLRRLLRDWAALVGAGILLLLGVSTVMAPWILPYGFAEVVAFPFEPASAQFWFGTDEIGRDIFTRIIYGARVSLTVGFVSTSIALVGGIPLGLISGYRGGLIDTVLMRLMDMMFAFPAIILALAIIAVLGPNLLNAMIAIGVMQIPLFARLVRGNTLSLKNQDYVQAAIAAGAGMARILTFHILPNTMSAIMVQFTLTFASAVLVEAALSFLGLGVAPPTPSWGAMLDTGRKLITVSPLYSVSAGAAIFVTVLGLNLVGDALRDALDPRMVDA